MDKTQLMKMTKSKMADEYLALQGTKVIETEIQKQIVEIVKEVEVPVEKIVEKEVIKEVEKPVEVKVPYKVEVEKPSPFSIEDVKFLVDMIDRNIHKIYVSGAEEDLLNKIKKCL